MTTTLPPSGATATLDGENFKAAAIGGVVFVRWFGDSTADEFLAITAFIRRSASASKRKVDLVGIVSPLNELPSAALREAMARFVVATRESIGATHIVFLGRHGFWQTIVRSIITSLMMVVRKHGDVGVHASVEAAVAPLRISHGYDVADVKSFVESEGLLGDRPGRPRGGARPSSQDSEHGY